MKAPIPHAVQELGLLCGILPTAIGRTDLGKHGEVWLETEKNGQRRWFRHERRLTEVFPDGDKRVPLCTMLDIEDEQVELLSWRPERRVALRVRSDDGCSIVKGLRPKRLNAAHDAYARVQAALKSDQDFIVPSIEKLPELSALRMNELALDPIGLSRRSESAYFQVGQALASFQRSVPIEGLGRHDFAKELEVLEQLATRHLRGMGECPPGWREARQRLQEFEPEQNGNFVAAHRDLHDGQLLTDDERVGLIDFDLLTSASPLLDIANLSVHLMLRALQGVDNGTPQDAEGCGRSLLVGFGIKDDGETHAELRAYQAATFLRLALIYSMRPRWRRLADPLIRYAERCLDEPRLV